MQMSSDVMSVTLGVETLTAFTVYELKKFDFSGTKTITCCLKISFYSPKQFWKKFVFCIVCLHTSLH